MHVTHDNHTTVYDRVKLMGRITLYRSTEYIHINLSPAKIIQIIIVQNQMLKKTFGSKFIIEEIRQIVTHTIPDGDGVVETTNLHQHVGGAVGRRTRVRVI